MKLPRRKLLHLAAGAAALPAFSRRAWALDYPTRPVRLLVGALPGSSPDVIARLMAQWLGDRLGQAFVVENRAGANGNLAAEVVVRAAPDGYTLFLSTASQASNPSLYSDLSFDFARDIAPIASLVSFPTVITVTPSFPAQTLPELMAYAEANPGKINIGTPGTSSPQYLALELFKMMTGLNIIPVAYRGGPPAISDALSGQIQGVVGTVLLVIAFVRSGKLRALAVTSTDRAPLLAEIPTVDSFVPGFEASQWIGLGARAKTPAVIIDKLNAEINTAMIDPTIKARITNLGGTMLPGSPAAFGEFIAAETDKWAKVIKFANIKPE